jgi:CHAP domain
MSVESVLARVATIEQALANPASLLATAARTGGTAAPVQPEAEPAAPTSGPSFAEVLQSASSGTPSAATPTASTATVDSPTLGAPSTVGATSMGTLLPTQGLTGATGGVGQQIVRIAETQIGQTEQPPGSNESPVIAGYRTATAGAVPGAPWCAYFASWAARQAGEPLGSGGEGLGSVSQISSWAQSTGRAIPNGPGVTPQPGDLIVFGDEHVGIVKEVLPNGDIQTIEGNYENKVALNVRTPTEATSYVNMN